MPAVCAWGASSKLAQPLAQVTRRIFTFNDPDTLLMAVHPSARNILGDANLAFMHGPAHKVSFLHSVAASRNCLCSTGCPAVGTLGAASLFFPRTIFVSCVLAQAIRKSFLSLFTRKALNTYVQCQDGVIRDHVGAWLSQHSGTELDVKRIIRCAVAGDR